MLPYALFKIDVNIMKSPQEHRDIQLLLDYHHQHTTLLSSLSHSFLLKTLPTLSSSSLQQVKQTLDLHQSLDSTQFLPLLHYQFTPNGTLHAVYRHSKHSLRDQINRRTPNEQSFTVNELWRIVISIVQAFASLSLKGISYGVLDCNRIYLEDKVLLVDPSSVGVDPYDPDSLTLCSPQILAGKQSMRGTMRDTMMDTMRDTMRDTIDIEKSDIYVLGLCVLQAALLTRFEEKEIEVEMCLRDLQAMYEDEDLMFMVASMLQNDPQERISLSQLTDILTNKFPQEYSFIILQQKSNDEEDGPCVEIKLDSNECERCDIKIDCENDEDNQVSQLEQARRKILGVSNRVAQGVRKEKVLKQTSKQIKNKLVTKRPSAENIFDTYYYNSQQSLYTDPKLLSMIQSSLMRHSQNPYEKENKSIHNRHYTYKS